MSCVLVGRPSPAWLAPFFASCHAMSTGPVASAQHRNTKMTTARARARARGARCDFGFMFPPTTDSHWPPKEMLESAQIRTVQQHYFPLRLLLLHALPALLSLATPRLRARI